MKILKRIKDNPLSSLIIFVLLLWIIYPLGLKFFLSSNDWNILGTFGDTYGALNTLFSGLAFAVLILSLFLQRKELEAQRIELEAQRQEIKESNTIAEAQRKITEQQATLIEQQIKDANVQSFYQLLFQYLEEKNRKVIASSSAGISGLQTMQGFYNAFKRAFDQYNDYERVYSIDKKNLDEKILEASTFAHAEINYKLKAVRYAEYINFILNYIDNNQHLDIKDNAISVFMAYMNVHEIICMFCLALEKNELFENLKKLNVIKKLEFDHELENEGFFLALIERKLLEL
ncbi:hypothetical protein [Acinetobacter genomosp. 33YU]|uniref:hypothetical protein n=1 Tax=Acinetobacter genomosp. 33YU TaxID=1675530 RepID=UPI00097F7DEC|nr:hypothetical protein [Acinetobacter genomosp. 33YU]